MRAALFFALGLLGSVGCDCSGAPRDACTTRSDCEPSQVCTDHRCVSALDAATLDSPTADVSERDTPVTDASFDANCVVVACLATETCGDGFDGDCDGRVDEDCACVPGSTTRCLAGRMDPSISRCSFGEMACEGAGEFGTWGACSGGGSDLDGGSSLYGCRRIGILGAPGANPSANFQAWLETQGAIATRIHQAPGAPTLRREELDTFDLVVIDWLQRTYTAEESTTLADWVRDGGGLFSMTGHDGFTSTERHNSLLAAVGPTYDLSGSLLNGPAILLPHPTTLDTDGVSTLPPVTFAGGRPVVVPAAQMADIVPIATIGADVVGVAGALGEGYVLIFGDEWIEFDSEWASMPPIPRFWQNAVGWLAPDESVLPACE